eukprot:gnl/MRDRNA2_/MRDRNA2_115511_c0_seq1.p1 gnl/MRDRNA2_/MRDRNA2_115511_c0~~gnl/MRDRNA2_/MRDRNA2_115511_c0_seq1.p1  ORF type:complete len:273 (-),score=54.56 gnl/MRDRNA2_/MRDRNA2_115511_c0_seq1:99-917(-)
MGRLFGDRNASHGSAMPTLPKLMGLLPQGEKAFTKPNDLASAMMQAVDVRYVDSGDRHMARDQYAASRKRSRARLKQAMQAVREQMGYGVASCAVNELKQAVEEAADRGLTSDELGPAQDLLAQLKGRKSGVQSRQVLQSVPNISKLLNNLNQERCERERMIKMADNPSQRVHREDAAVAGAVVPAKPELAPARSPQISVRHIDCHSEGMPTSRRSSRSSKSDQEVFTFVCPTCNRAETPITQIELMARGGVASCLICHWQGYPQQIALMKS